MLHAHTASSDPPRPHVLKQSKMGYGVKIVQRQSMYTFTWPTCRARVDTKGNGIHFRCRFQLSVASVEFHEKNLLPVMNRVE